MIAGLRRVEFWGAPASRPSETGPEARVSWSSPWELGTGAALAEPELRGCRIFAVDSDVPNCARAIVGATNVETTMTTAQKLCIGCRNLQAASDRVIDLRLFVEWHRFAKPAARAGS